MSTIWFEVPRRFRTATLLFVVRSAMARRTIKRPTGQGVADGNARHAGSSAPEMPLDGQEQPSTPPDY